MKVMLRLSNKGVPHILAELDNYMFSVCYMNRKGEGPSIYRIWLYDTQEKLLDVDLDKGGAFNLEFVLSGLVQKLNERTYVSKTDKEDEQKDS